MIGLFSLQQFNHSSTLTTVLWATTMLAVIARLAISVRENKRLLEQVRTDPLTWGSVEIPLEANTPATALQLADVRMYAQKQSRRVAQRDGAESGSAETEIRLRGPLYGKALEQRH